MGWAARAFIEASRDHLYADSSIIVFTTPVQLVELGSDIQGKIGLTPPPGAAPVNTPVKVDFTKVVTAVLSLASTLVSGLWPKAADATKWTQATIFNVASSLTSIFAPTPGSPANTLDLGDIEDAVQSIIDQDDARNQVPIILDTLDWLNELLAKSRAAAPNNLSDYDRGLFVGRLTDLLAPISPFLTAMRLLRENRDIRKYAIPPYLMGLYPCEG
jgi:hypothetical protein